MKRSGWWPTLCLGALLFLTACDQSLSTPPADEATVPRSAAKAARSADPSPRIASPATPVEQSGFADQLRGKGLTVERVDEAAQPFLRTYGATLRLSGGGLAPPGELIHAYVYDDPALAAADAQRVQPDISVRWTEPDGGGRAISFVWAAPPHFFQKGRVLVLYAGTNQTVLAVLTELLGPQFAGR